MTRPKAMPFVRHLRKGWVRVTDRKGRTVNLRVDELARLFVDWMPEEALQLAIRWRDRTKAVGEMLKRVYPPGSAKNIATQPRPPWFVPRTP